MADKNNNGIEDSQEKYRPGQKVYNTWIPTNGVSHVRRAPETTERGGTLQGFINSPVRQGLNFLGDLVTGFQRKERDAIGTGWGDLALGVDKGYYSDYDRQNGPSADRTVMNSWFGFPTDQSKVGVPRTSSVDPQGLGRPPGSLADLMRAANAGASGQGAGNPVDGQESDTGLAATLAEALAMLKSLPGAGGSVNYDPYRQSARQNYNEADANIGAIYRALASSIGADAAGIGSSYSGAIENQQGITEEAAQNIQQGYQSGNDMLRQQAAALGIEEAVANQINSGQTSHGDMTRALADNAGSGQTAQTQLNTNKQSALDYNTATKQAAEQEGAAQRAQRSAELASVLANLDVAEQEANRSAQQSQSDSALGLVKWLYETRQGESRYNDQVAQQALELALEQSSSPQSQESRINGSEATAYLMELLGYTDPKQYQEWLRENPTGPKNLYPFAQ